MTRQDMAAAALYSAVTFAIAFALLASCGLAFSTGDGIARMLGDALSLSVLFLLVAGPVAFFPYFFGALIFGAVIYRSATRLRVANRLTAATVSMAASTTAAWFLIKPILSFAVAAALAGVLAGVIYERVMRRRLKPRPAPPS